jgi:hypothetical protein
MSKIFRANDRYRQNELSLTPGGDTLIVHYGDGRIISYDKIKNPEAYCNYVLSKSGNNILKIESNGVQLFPNKQI